MMSCISGASVVILLILFLVKFKFFLFFSFWFLSMICLSCLYFSENQLLSFFAIRIAFLVSKSLISVLFYFNCLFSLLVSPFSLASMDPSIYSLIYDLIQLLLNIILFILQVFYFLTSFFDQFLSVSFWSDRILTMILMFLNLCKSDLY